MVENFTQGESMKVTQEFLNGLEKAIGQHNREIKAGKSDFNLIDAFGLKRKEVYHSKLLAYFLDGVNNNHYQQIFLEKFLEKLQKEKNIPSKIFKRLMPQDIQSIEIEAPTKKNRRIDILITCTDNTYIVIENKIDACDQVSQIKDYVLDIQRRMGRKLSESEKANRILVIYLTPYQDNPSEMSFGKTSERKQNYWYLEEEEEGTNRIYNEKDVRMAYYYKMDYKWVEQWLMDCKAYLRKQSQTKARGEEQTRGEKGLNKVIFGIEQYLEILEDINCEKVRSNSIVNFIIQDNKYKMMALEIYNDTEHKYQYQHHESIEHIWKEFSRKILEDFFNRFVEEFEDEDICLGSNTQLRESLCRWGAFAYDSQCTNTLYHYHIGLYPQEYSNSNIWLGINLSFFDHNFEAPTLDIDLVWNDEGQEECERLQREIQDELKKKDSEKCKDVSRVKSSYNWTFEEGSFIEWIIRQGGNDIRAFKEKITEFLDKECVKKAFDMMVKKLEARK